MKQGFNRSGQMTYASRRQELEAHAEQIDTLLRTPKSPGVHFTPDGIMRRNANKYARDVLTQKRIDIAQELEAIAQQKQRAYVQSQAQQIAKSKPKSLK